MFKSIEYNDSVREKYGINIFLIFQYGFGIRNFRYYKIKNFNPVHKRKMPD